MDGEGKSGNFYASRFADENFVYSRSITSTRGFTKLIAARREQKTATKGIVVIDDIIASGMSLSANLKAFVDENEAALREMEVPFIVFAITSTASGDEVVRSTLDGYSWLKWDLRVGSYLNDSAYAFGASSGIWADESERERAKALVIDFGARIYRDNPLGFDGQALLVVFPDTCPNNTLPIIHSSLRKGQKLGSRCSGGSRRRTTEVLCRTNYSIITGPHIQMMKSQSELTNLTIRTGAVLSHALPRRSSASGIHQL